MSLKATGWAPYNDVIYDSEDDPVYTFSTSLNILLDQSKSRLRDWTSQLRDHQTRVPRSLLQTSYILCPMIFPCYGRAFLG